MQVIYSKSLSLLHALCLAENLRDDEPKPNIDLNNYDALAAADYLSCFITFKAILAAERSPATERSENFDMLSVYQAYGLLVYAFLANPLTQEGIKPDFQAAQVTIAKTLFAGMPHEELAEIVEAGLRKFQLIAEATTEHWQEYRENLDKVSIAFVIAGTDDDSPHEKEEMLPIFGQLLSQLCEAFVA
jgi:hypothetical protein